MSFRLRSATTFFAASSLLALAACNPNEIPPPTTTTSVQPIELLVLPGTGDSVATPAGWRPKACVKEIPNGAHVSRTGVVRRRDGTTFQIAKCNSTTVRPHIPGLGSTSPGGIVAPIDTGWMEWSSYAVTSGSFRSLTAGWRVPAAPTGSYSGIQTYYSFPGLRNADYIVQPVIQYGYNGAYGGSYWTAVSWHCDFGLNCTHGTPILVYPGDSIVGTATATSCVNSICTWTITTVDQTRNTRSDWTVDDDDSYRWATGGAVEVYWLTSCSQFPVSGIWYSGLAIYDRNSTLQSPDWTPNYFPNPNPSCQFNVTSSASTVQLYHNYTTLSTWVTGDTATSMYTAHGSGGVTPYSYYWEWCAIECDGGGGDDLRTSSLGQPNGGIRPRQVEHGWNEVYSTDQSICWTMSESQLRVTVTDWLGSQSVSYYTVPVLYHVYCT